jgi:5-methylcytosine-specific restriction endonuclease McrA
VYTFCMIEGALNKIPDIEQDAVQVALEKRTLLQESLQKEGVPNREYIQMCKDIISLFPSTEESADRTGRFPKTVKKMLIKKYGGCVACGEKIIGGSRHTPVLEVHHIIPREHGGDESKENGVLFCRKCHVEVHA